MKCLKSILLVGLLALAGCEKQVTLFSGLEERQANAVIAALIDNGMNAEKAP